MSRIHALASASILIALVVAGCVGAPHVPAESVRGPPVVNIVATDFALEAPATMPSGIVEVVLENRGADWHHVTFYKLEQGRTLEELREALVAGHGATPSWARLYGGPNLALPGEGPQRAVLDLDPGVYVILCLIPSADHVMHLAKGMMALVTVLPPATDHAVQAPEPTHTATLDDFSFSLSAPIHAGKSVLRVANIGEHTHELVLFELFGNASTMEYLTLLEDPNATSPPPGRGVGGATPISPGETVLLPLDLPPGRYSLVCFDTTGTPENSPHFLHGMVHEFEVQ